jgi:hypothetical protein
VDWSCPCKLLLGTFVGVDVAGGRRVGIGVGVIVESGVVVVVEGGVEGDVVVVGVVGVVDVVVVVVVGCGVVSDVDD